MRTSSIILSMLFSSIGVGYCIYGRKQQKFIALFSGIVMCVFPYFIQNVFLSIVIGLVLMALPFFM